MHDEILGEAIRAVVVLRPGAAVDAADIREHCMRRLPLFKVPRRIEFSSDLPRTATGKIRRHLLAAETKTTTGVT
jgi:acyl-CoA synthetase (AMP-forming)/AMP-acid ligase II